MRLFHPHKQRCSSGLFRTRQYLALIDWKQVREIVRRLDNLLSEYDAEALSLWMKYRPLLKPVMGSKLEAFESAMANYDFSDARTVLGGGCGNAGVFTMKG